MFRQGRKALDINVKIDKGEAWFDSEKIPKKRYFLEKRWEKKGEILGAILMNPSTADEKKNDRTVDRLITYAKEKNYAALYLVNIIPCISSDPNGFRGKSIPDVKEPQQEKAFKYMFNHVNDVYIGWGEIGQEHFSVLIENENIRKNFLDKSKIFYATDVSSKEFPYHPHQKQNSIPSLEAKSDLEDVLSTVKTWAKNK